MGARGAMGAGVGPLAGRARSGNRGRSRADVESGPTRGAMAGVGRWSAVVHKGVRCRGRAMWYGGPEGGVGREWVVGGNVGSGA